VHLEILDLAVDQLALKVKLVFQVQLEILVTQGLLVTLVKLDQLDQLEILDLLVKTV
jgi:hypothetical protein